MTLLQNFLRNQKADNPHFSLDPDLEQSLLKNSLAYPAVIACVSVNVLLVHALKAWYGRKSSDASVFRDGNGTENADESTRRLSQKFVNNVKSNGGLVAYSFMVARVLGCLTLVGLSAASLANKKGTDLIKWLPLSPENLPELLMFVTYVYTSILAVIAILSPAWRRVAVRHNISVLLVALGVYTYRDVWPLATYILKPIDAAEGCILWAKLSILGVTAVIIPLFVPQIYTPADPNNASEIPHPEQTACLFSAYFYNYLDPVIFKARNGMHLSHDQFPPISDYDRSEYMKGYAFPHLDSFQLKKKRHIFFGLMRVHAWEYVYDTIATTGFIVFGFASPLAILRILTYLETGRPQMYIRPWFWIMLLFIGPIIMTVSFASHFFILSKIIVRTEALLTQLIFEHSLRVRIKAEAPEKEAVESSREDLEAADNSLQQSSQESMAVGTSESSSTPPVSLAGDGQSTKGKERAASTKSSIAPGNAQAKAQNFIGKLNNLVTIDLHNITGASDILLIVYHIPVQMFLCTVFLYNILGWSSFVGFASMIALLPAPGYFAKLLQTAQRNKMDKTDTRVQSVTEIINVLRMIKLFGWENRMNETIESKREVELRWIRTVKGLELVTNAVNFVIPTVTMLVTFATYTIIMKESLTASRVFSSMAIFDIMRSQLHHASWIVGQVIKGKVSLDRSNEFLHETELLDAFTPKSETNYLLENAEDEQERDVIGFKDASFSWSADASKGSTPSSRSYKLTVEGELLFRQGRINLILGPTGSGKTSVLLALLGEMHFSPPTPDSWFSLPRGGGIAYAAQESWVQNETIKDNIIFDADFDEKRYKKVLYQCALERDIELFEAGDQTEVGERGLTLSGGQKARVTLARAVYSNAEILLLDDILAALDVHTSKWIVEKCLQGDLIKGRTVLLVTHNVALTSTIADYVVSVASDGRLLPHSSDALSALGESALLADDAQYDVEDLSEKETLPAAESPADQKKGKLILAEEIQEGDVSWKTFRTLLNGLGGNHVVFFFFFWISGATANHVVQSFSVWYLGYWGSQYENSPPQDIPVNFYMMLYAGIVLLSLISYLGPAYYYVLAVVRASRSIHQALMTSILGTTLRWLDETPVSRIIMRSTQDIGALDSSLTQHFEWLIDLAILAVIDLGAAVLFVPVFAIPGLVIGSLGMYAGGLYLKAQLSVKREMSNAKSPMLAHFGAAVGGLVSIRAYSAQATLKHESLKRIDHYVRIARLNYDLNRWIGVRIDLLGALFTASLAAYLVYGRSISAANTGFSLIMAVELCSAILFLVRVYNQFQVEANSLERIVGYTEIEQEPKATESGKPPASWPSSGELCVEHLSAQYSKSGPVILHDISFEVHSGERIGIVGRTGSGKSSLTLSLLRCILTEGNVLYDGIPTDKINLDALRTSITIIPQMPELLSGSLRHNLDPFDQYDDATLNDALQSAGLFSLQNGGDDSQITLDSGISSAGGNLSVGQRQIIALARAIIRGSKLLILDEATSAIDHKTDSVIQSTLRHKLGSDVTVLIVAHRLQTIMDADRIMVLDAGHIVEFDSPDDLLAKKGGFLKALVDESGDQEALYKMAGNLASSSIL